MAASCLLPIAESIVNQLPESLDRVLIVLWQCLSDMKDDLSSSVGVVMDLLGMIPEIKRHFPSCLTGLLFRRQIGDLRTSYSPTSQGLRRVCDKFQFIYTDSPTCDSLPLSTLAQTLFPFFRHTIANVRLAVVNTLQSFMVVSELPTDWVATPFLSLLFQNLISEERDDIRDASLFAWQTALTVLSTSNGRLENVITQQLILDWYAMTMTPLGTAIDTTTFHRPSVAQANAAPIERHNVDKNMLAQDLSLITVEVTLKARIAASTALAYLMAYWPNQVRFQG